MEQPVVNSNCSRRFWKTNNGTLRWVSTTFDRQTGQKNVSLQTVESWQWYCSRLLFRRSRAWMVGIPSLETCNNNTRNLLQGILQLTYWQEEVC